MKFNSLIENLKAVEKDYGDAASELVRKYPQSSRLVEITKELEENIESMTSLREELQQLVETADLEKTLFVDLLDQLKRHPLVEGAAVTEADKKNLAETLVQHGLGVPSMDEIKEGLASTWMALPVKDLILQLPKKEIIKKGKEALEQQPEADQDAFNQYNEGLLFFEQEFAKEEIKKAYVDELVAKQLQEKPFGSFIQVLENKIKKEPGKDKALKEDIANV